MGRHYSPTEVDAILEERFRGKRCRLTLPGQEPVYGIVNRIAMDPRKVRERIINIEFNGRGRLDTCSLDCLHECLVVTAREKESNHATSDTTGPPAP